jgi:hypothetical protein
MMTMMIERARMVVVLAALLGFIPLNLTRASKCDHAQNYGPNQVGATREIPFDATIWVQNVVDDSTESCRLAPVNGGADVPADLVIHGGGRESAEAGGGCASSGSRFGMTLGELVPLEPLTPDQTYKVECEGGGRSTFALEKLLAITDHPQTFETLEIVTRDARRHESPCDHYIYLRLELEPIDDAFFGSNGLLLVEYGDDRVDLILGVERHESSSVAIVDLPLPGDNVITIRAINGLGDEVASESVDVDGIGEEGGGCRIAERPGGDLAILFPLLLLAAGRSDRGRAGSPRRDPALDGEVEARDHDQRDECRGREAAQDRAREWDL